MTQGHYVLGIAGLGLLRSVAQRDGKEANRITANLLDIASKVSGEAYSRRHGLPLREVSESYSEWAASYDQRGNRSKEIEERIVRALIVRSPKGTILDAGCGTGRHMEFLEQDGRRCIGVDSNPEMLAEARRKMPSADLRTGELESLPVQSGSCSGVLCSLCLCHLRDIRPAIAEMARVLRPGGSLVISNPHPFATAVLGWGAHYVDDQGSAWSIPEYAHGHSAFIEAFTSEGLSVRSCVEPTLSSQEARARAKRGHAGESHPAVFERALAGLPVSLIWEVQKV